MAVVQNTLIGRSRNKVGGTVFSTWKGKNVLKSKPLTVANPQTDGQLAQRSKMRQLVNLFRFMLIMIRYSFKEVSAGSTEWASFMKYNLQNAFTVAGPDATLVPGDLIFSRGTLVQCPNMELLTSTTTGFTATWTDNTGTPGANASDILAYAIVTADEEVRVEFTGIVRADEAATVTYDSAVATAAAQVYIWWINTSLRKSSDSVGYTT